MGYPNNNPGIIQKKISGNQTKNRRNSNNKKAVFCLDLLYPDNYFLDFAVLKFGFPRLFRKPGQKIDESKNLFFFAWISCLLNLNSESAK
jgi:hypothetical protein